MTTERKPIQLIALATVMVISTSMAFVIGVVAPYLRQDLGLSVLHIGGLTSALYAVSSAFSASAGRVADRIGSKRAMQSLVALVALSYFGLAASWHYGVMLLAVVVAGAGNALGNPATNKAVVELMPTGRRGSALGWKQAGVPLGALAAGALIPAMAQAMGWRGAILWVGSILFVVGFVSSLALRKRALQTPAHHSLFVPTVGEGAVSLKYLNVLTLTMGMVTGAFQSYFVLYGVESLQFTEGTAGLLFGVVGATGAVTRIVWAGAAERGRGAGAALRLMAPLSVAGIGLVLLASVIHPWLIWPAAALCGLAIFAYTSLGMLALVTHLPEGHIGTATGTFARAFFGGILGGTLAFGGITDLSGSYTLAWLFVLAQMSLATLIIWRHSFLTPRLAAT